MRLKPQALVELSLNSREIIEGENMKYIAIWLCLAVGAFGVEQIRYDVRLSYTGSKDAPISIKTRYCKGSKLKCGVQTKTTKDGVLIFKAHYTNDKYDGEVLSYYNNGKPKESRTYVMGKEEGKRVLYYQNGNIQSEQTYMANKREGEGKKYYENGILQERYTYANDVREGLREEFDKYGNKEYETMYKNGKKQWNRHYDAQGVLLEEKNCRLQACY